MMGVSTLPSSHPQADAAGAAPGWSALARELDAWAKADRTATFWWRDDDAVAATPELRRLLDLARHHGAPLALAVIPRRAEPGLFAALAGYKNVRVLQHGYDHANHAPAGAKKCELGPERPPAKVLAELAEGRARLRKAAAGLLLDALVPPWNRIDPAVAAGLPGLGFIGLSAANPRPAARDAAGLLRANTHVDPVDWHGGRGFVGESAALGAALKHLAARRLGDADRDEPTGLLTHHLVQDAACWRFVDRFLAATTRHPRARWLDAAMVFGPAS
ncbi:MAG: polysaccharide deacetylase family protein [Rhodospirillales bacterium]